MNSSYHDPDQPFYDWTLSGNGDIEDGKLTLYLTLIKADSTIMCTVFGDKVYD